MTDPRIYLQDVLAKAEAATEGPWESTDIDPGVWSPDVIVFGNYTAADQWESPCWADGAPDDRAFIASSRTTVPVMARALLAVLDKHAPVSRVFSWSSGSYTVPRCPDCLGRAGVHECGCWRDTDETYSCGECSTERDGVDWPCPTVTTITTELAKEDRA